MSLGSYASSSLVTTSNSCDSPTTILITIRAVFKYGKPSGSIVRQTRRLAQHGPSKAEEEAVDDHCND